MASVSQPDKPKYIYDLPFFERSELCKILNQNDKWRELAGMWMNYDMLTIENLSREKNPTDELLTLWSIHNHTILELFVLLSKMQHYRAMMPLKSHVDSKYHILIDRGEGNIKNALAVPHREQHERPNTLRNSKDFKIGAQNFDRDVPFNFGVLPNICIRKSPDKILNQADHRNHTEHNHMVPSNSNNLLVPSPTPERVNALSQKLNELTFGKSDVTLPQISHEELTRATNDWDVHKIIGKGGFGTVYRGIWKNTDVAIKKIQCRGRESHENYIIQLQQSFREITILNSRPHENILSLYAFSFGEHTPCLVYQFMTNGSVADRLQLLQNTPPLSWFQRYEIAKGTARGLQYLHTIGDKPLIHGDIKSANILLDKNFEPRIGDFGLAREGPANDSMKVSKIHGTRPYLPEEFLRNKYLSTKIDTYSYGVVLFELATGLTAYDDSRPKDKLLKDFVNNAEMYSLKLMMDNKAGDDVNKIYSYLLFLGKSCTKKLAEDRPEMATVFEILNNIKSYPQK